LGELIQSKRDALSEIETELDRLAQQRTDSRILLELYDSVFKSNLDVSTMEVKDALSLSGAIGLGAKKARSAIVRARATSLFDLWKKTMEIEDYANLIKRVLGYEVSSHDVAAQKRYAALIERDAQVLRNRWSDFVRKKGAGPNDFTREGDEG
jgi:hypothetical protein